MTDTIPETYPWSRIFAWREEDPDRPGTYTENCWCRHDDDDPALVEYVRRDLFDAAEAEVARLREAGAKVLTAVEKAKANGAPHKLSPMMAVALGGLRAALQEKPHD